ncbi:MAG: DinB family protein [Patescibacteria group bacterium]
MNALRIVERGHQNFLDTLKDLPENKWTDGFVTGSWTVKDVISHLATYEALQVEAFRKSLDPGAPTPLLDQKAKGSFLEFNDWRWSGEKEKKWQEVLSEYNSSFAELKGIVEKIPRETMAKPSTATWYGESSELDDIIALNFGHKKHHLAQIKLFRQRNEI